MKAYLAFVLSIVAGDKAAAQAPSSNAAETAFKDGLALMKRGDFARACPVLELSQRLDPQYGTEYNLAICYVRIHRLFDAWELYSHVSVGDRDIARAAHAAQAADEIWPSIPKLHLKLDRAVVGLHVAIDARDVTPQVNRDIPVDVGRHAVEASLPGADTFHQDVELSPGQRAELQIVFAPQPTRHAISQTAPEEVSRSSTRRSFGLLAIGSGSAIAIGGLAAGLVALEYKHHGAPAQASAWSDLSTATVAVGGIAIGGGIYLWRTSRGEQIGLNAAAAPSQATLAVTGTF